MKLLSGLKTITTIQEGGVYKERWTCPSVDDPFPIGATAQTSFKDSAGAEIISIDGTFETPIAGGFRHLVFLEQPDVMSVVPNGATFEVIVTDELGPNYFKYGTVFRRQNFFPHSPAELTVYEPKRFTDTFQRPAGALGGRWRNLVGQPVIFDNVDFWTGGDGPNTVGPQWNFFTRYFTRYYVPFNGDSVDLSINVVDKGGGDTIVALCCNSEATSYLYARFTSLGTNETIELGIGHGPDIGPWGSPTGVLETQIESLPLVIPDDAMVNYKMRFDEATKEFAFYNSDYTTKIASWVDDADDVPHGKGYRYFAIGGNSGIFDSGVQIGYISASNIV